MIYAAASSGFSIVSSLFVIGAIFSIIEFRKKLRLVRSHSNNRDLDVYVPYNMLFVGLSHLRYRRLQTRMPFPYDENNDDVLQELRNSWVISLTMVLTIWFGLGTGFLALISHFNSLA
jgi:hypothetical protein